jgi:hypothetical protein
MINGFRKEKTEMNEPQIHAGSSPAPRTADARLFSRGLYRDALRRLRIAGLVMAGLCAAITLLFVLSIPQSGRWSPGLSEGVISLSAFGLPLAVFSLVAPPLLILQAFFFLYQRNGSDFYHTLPCSRLSLGVSLLAAALTWACAGVLATLLICAAALPALGLPFRYLGLLLYLLAHVLGYCLASGALTAGCALIGVSLSGTPWIGALIAGLALYLPRFILTIYRIFFVQASNLMVYGDAGAFLSPMMHLPTVTLLWLARGTWGLGRILGRTVDQLQVYGPGIAYTAALGVVALAVGLWCFTKRPSELAGQTRPARVWARAALTVCVTLPLALGAAYVLYRYARTDGSDGMPVLQGLAYILIAALVIIPVAVGLRARSWRGALRVAACLLLSAALAAALTWSGIAVGKHTRAQRPKSADIVSVRFPAQAGNYSPTSSLFNPSPGDNLIDTLTEGILHTAPEIREFMASALSENAAMLDAQDAGEGVQILGQQVTAELRLKDGQLLRRTVRVSDAQRTLLLRELTAVPAYVEALRQVPAQPIVSMEDPTTYFSSSMLPSVLWETLCDELEAADDRGIVATSLSGLLPYTAIEKSPFFITALEWRGATLLKRVYDPRYATPATNALCFQAHQEQYGEAFAQALAKARELPSADGLPQARYFVDFEFDQAWEGGAVSRPGELSALQPWDLQYDNLSSDGYIQRSRSVIVGVPDREAYEATRIAENQKILDIITRSPAAKGGDTRLLFIRISVPQWNKARNADPAAYLFGDLIPAYLVATQADIDTLVEICLRREQEGLW